MPRSGNNPGLCQTRVSLRRVWQPPSFPPSGAPAGHGAGDGAGDLGALLLLYMMVMPWPPPETVLLCERPLGSRIATTCRGALVVYEVRQLAVIMNLHFALVIALPRWHRVDHQVSDNLTLAIESEDVGHASSRNRTTARPCDCPTVARWQWSLCAVTAVAGLLTIGITRRVGLNDNGIAAVFILDRLAGCLVSGRLLPNQWGALQYGTGRTSAISGLGTRTSLYHFSS